MQALGWTGAYYVDADHIANAEATDTCKGNFVKLSVEPDAKKYTISIPATKFEQSFDVKKAAE